MTDTLATIRCRNSSNRRLTDYPITCAVPMPKGKLLSAGRLAASLPRGRVVPVQAQVTEKWSDGSVKWLVLDFEMPFAANPNAGDMSNVSEVRLIKSARTPATRSVSARADADAMEATTPHYRVVVNRRKFSIFDAYVVNGKNMVLPGSDIVVEDLNGKKYYASLAKRLDSKVLLNGPRRSVLEVSGRHTAEDGSEMLSFRVRYVIRAGDPCCQLSYKFTNREEPETGVKLAGIRVVIPTALDGPVTRHVRQSVHGETWFPRPLEVHENVELIAGKAVNESARARYGSVAEGKIVIRNFSSLREDLSAYPYYLRPGNARTDMSGGLRQMYPYLGASASNGSVLGWFSEMENHFPKAVGMDRNVFWFDIWPASFGELHVRRGQSCEHDLYMNLASKSRRFEQIESLYLDHEVMGFGILSCGAPPVSVTLDPDYVRSCEVLNLHRWLRYDEDKYLRIETKLGSVGPTAAGPKGMWDYGDYISPDRSWAHNNENDSILQLMQEYFRRAEPTCLTAAVAKARHNAHVDFIVYDPHPLRQGTMPAHCPEHTDGATYPSHMWVDGLMAVYHATGEPDLLEAAIAVGENMRRWQLHKKTFFADSRECGWPMLAYLCLYEHTRDRKWLRYTQEVFEFYRTHMTDKGEILYDIPHGMGTSKQGYGEFITWRACFFYHELTGLKAVKDFLVKSLRRVYHFPAKNAQMPGGWGCNDMFPAWALYKLTGERKVLEDNIPFVRAIMEKPANFPWGGIDMHPYLAELDKLGMLESIVKS